MICGLSQILNNDINSCPPVRLLPELHHDKWPPVSAVWLQAVCFAARCISRTLHFSSFLHFKHPIYFLYEMDLVDWIIFTVGGSLWAWKWNEVPDQSWTGTTSKIAISFSSNCFSYRNRSWIVLFSRVPSPPNPSTCLPLGDCSGICRLLSNQL